MRRVEERGDATRDVSGVDQAFKVASRVDGDFCEFCAKRWAPVPVPQATVSGH